MKYLYCCQKPANGSLWDEKRIKIYMPCVLENAWYGFVEEQC